MKGFGRYLEGVPLLGRAWLMFVRLKVALGYFADPARQLVIWLFKSRQVSDFTYDLDEMNKRYLTAFVAQVTSKKYGDIMNYITELEKDNELREHVQRITRASKDINADRDVNYGRRLGWYAIVRAVRPRVVVETGVAAGLGACTLIAALMRNAAEGFPGRYYGTDINPEAGYLLKGEYAAFGEILYGDSIESLKKFNRPVDVFVNDSNHSAEYEAAEYRTIQNRLSPNAIVLGDNAHCTDKLLEFALHTGRRFLFFQEKPHKHWYPGAGIGAVFCNQQIRRRRRPSQAVHKHRYRPQQSPNPSEKRILDKRRLSHSPSGSNGRHSD